MHGDGRGQTVPYLQGACGEGSASLYLIGQNCDSDEIDKAVTNKL